MITPIYFSNIYTHKNNTQNNKQIINNLAPLQYDNVCFSGAVKVLSDICDRAFVNILTKDLNLDEKSATKLKDTVWKFLRENKANSLGELGGDEHFDEQVELQERITKVLSISEDDDESNEYIANEIIKRCDDGKDYIPLGFEGFNKGKLLENILSGKIKTSLRDCMEQMISDSTDNSFYKFAKKMLRQTPEESYKFRKTIEEYLKANNFKSITELFSDEEAIGYQAGLIEKLESKFNLSETESTALNFAFLERTNTNSERFTTGISTYVKDIDSVAKITENMGLTEHKVGDWNFNSALFREMSTEAQEKGLNNVFELLENDFKQSRTYRFIREESGLTEEQQTDLIIELTKVAKDPEAFDCGIPKHSGRDNFYANIQTEMISKKITKTFGISDPDSEIFEDVVSKRLQDTVRKIFPEHVTGGENLSIKQIAFEIADSYKLPVGAEKTIEKIINEIQNGGTKLADVYAFEKFKSDLDIE